MRILGIDFGIKRMGLAISDEMGMMGHGIATLTRKNPEYDSRELRKTIEKYSPETIVVGLPKNMDGSLGPAAQQVLDFVDYLKQTFSLPVETWDERLSTVEAERVMLEADMSRRKRKKNVDKIAAAIILQGYLDYINRNQSL